MYLETLRHNQVKSIISGIESDSLGSCLVLSDSVFFLFFPKWNNFRPQKFSPPSGAILTEIDRCWSKFAMKIMFLARRRRNFWVFSSRKFYFCFIFWWISEKCFKNFENCFITGEENFLKMKQFENCFILNEKKHWLEPIWGSMKLYKACR